MIIIINIIIVILINYSIIQYDDFCKKNSGYMCPWVAVFIDNISIIISLLYYNMSQRGRKKLTDRP